MIVGWLRRFKMWLGGVYLGTDYVAAEDARFVVNLESSLLLGLDWIKDVF